MWFRIYMPQSLSNLSRQLVKVISLISRTLGVYLLRLFFLEAHSRMSERCAETEHQKSCEEWEGRISVAYLAMSVQYHILLPFLGSKSKKDTHAYGFDY